MYGEIFENVLDLENTEGASDLEEAHAESEEKVQEERIEQSKLDFKESEVENQKSKESEVDNNETKESELENKELEESELENKELNGQMYGMKLSSDLNEIHSCGFFDTFS